MQAHSDCAHHGDSSAVKSQLATAVIGKPDNGGEKRCLDAEGASGGQDPGLVVIPHTHGHSQWRMIAEEFSALLRPDFVDLVFKVRGGSLLSAHRTLVAAAWPVLQDELQRFTTPPSAELKEAGLSWKQKDSAKGTGDCEPLSPRLPQQQEAFEQNSPSSGATASVSPPAGGAVSADGGGVAEGAPRRVPEVTDANAHTVFDVSSRPWGTYNIVRALLRNLYCWNVTVHERELVQLKAAAQSIGCTELAKLCEDASRRKPPRIGLVPPKAGLQEYSDPGTQAIRHLHSSNSVSTDASLTNQAAGTEETDITTGNSSQGPVRVHSRPPKESQQQVPVCKPIGDGSAHSHKTSTMANAEKPAAETGVLRRVLSDIKANIVESSRIIADTTFQQMYEMVPGERGVLGEGINGPVRMARHRKDGREVAVKRIHCVNLSEQRRQMLVSEVRIFLQVSHRNIVQLLEVYESEIDQAVLLVMELCTGRELFERLAERKWYSEFDAARVARQMLDAVSYLHSQNICHRDLKLENWLYENPSPEAKLKLCDFGFGQIVEPSVQLTATLGSLYYLAPEVLEGSYGLPCDMWSIGVIVYMLLSGVPPFDGKTDELVISKIRQGRFASGGKRWESISESAKHFVRSILRKDPYERLTSVEAAQHAWLKMERQPKASFSWPKGNIDAELELPIDRGVIRDMRKFAQNNAIARAALGMLAKSTVSISGREEDVQKLEKRFRSYDDQKTGKIDAESFVSVLKEALQLSSFEEKNFLERLTATIPDPDLVVGDVEVKDNRKPKEGRRREVNYNDFITLTKARRIANNTAAIREAFRTFDQLGDGYIEEKEMHSLLGEEFKSTIDDYVDVNGKDLIDYADFANIFSKELAKKEDLQDQAAEAEENAKVAPLLPKPSIEDGVVLGPDSRDMGTSATECVLESSDANDTGVAAIISANSEVVGIERAGSGSPADGLGDQRKDVPCTDEEAKASDQNTMNPQEMVEEEEDAEADAEADAQSDEEQLVNVEKAATTSEASLAGGDKKGEEKLETRVGEKPKEASRFQSFSLSLAGSSEHDDHFAGAVNRVVSMPSDVYQIRQLPGFHTRILRPFYAARPVSNVVMGLIRGTSLYARQSVTAKLATIIHTTWGWFFIMPNPKYHTEVDTRKGLLSRETGKFRFVAWWIHPRFVPQLRQWFEKFTQGGETERKEEQRREARAHREARARESAQGERSSDGARVIDDGAASDSGKAAAVAATTVGQTAEGPPEISARQKPAALMSTTGAERERTSSRPDTQDLASKGTTSASEVPPQATTTPQAHVAKSREGPAEGEAAPGAGNPGDFRFSDVPKPENYLHTYRDLHTREHVAMLSQLYDGTFRFLRSLFDENFMTHAHISAGFHYPVRTQYATLHMQVRVNSGSVCRNDNRGMEVSTLIDNMKRDRKAYERDEETIKYHVTENVKVSLLAAADEFEGQNSGVTAHRQSSPLTYELGLAAMPTIQDDEDEEHEADDTAVGPEHVATKSEEADAATVTPTVSMDVTGSTAVATPSSPPACLGKKTFLINLQPTVGSDFELALYACRESCKEKFGADATHLYPLHISATGFLEIEEDKVERLVKLMQEIVQAELSSGKQVTVGKVICTETGYVLYDINAPAICSFSKKLVERSSRELDVYIRPKNVNHISLACNHPEPASREAIRAIFEPEGDDAMKKAVGSATFDLVLSRLERRSSCEALAEHGPHKFTVMTRIPLKPIVSTCDDFKTIP
eukprot:TRINITY_DN43304_c0_g1_i1.p1 TRINITY_DN43304_c0_g1~~TRINITY_DN43304_c0_g1_i1.p1  ORF type:complete len:1767 (-),score=274.93 TRINITY_DN43304_c0_g1_i1:68-5302(-)